MRRFFSEPTTLRGFLIIGLIAFVVVVLNLTPVPREQYRIGVPEAATYVELLSSDDPRFGGNGGGTGGGRGLPGPGCLQRDRLRPAPDIRRVDRHRRGLRGGDRHCIGQQHPG